MADAGGIRAGKAFVELALKDDLTKALDKSARQLKDFGQSITDIGKKTLGLGVAITAPLLVAAQRFAAMGDEVNKASLRTGIGAQALTELKYAAEHSAVSFEDLETGVKKMQKTIFEAAVGSDTATKALSALNLTVQDLKDLKPEDQLTLISNRLSDIVDPAARTAVAMEVMGKGGTKLLTMAGQIEQLRQRARDLGITFSTEDAEAATVFGDNLMDIGLQLKAVVFQIGAAVAQALLPFASTVQRVLRGVIEWAKENRGLIFTVLTAGAAVIALGAALLGLGVSIQLFGAALSGIAGGFKLISAAIALVSNPVVLVIAGLTALVAYFLYATESGGRLLAWLGDRFNDLTKIAKEAFAGIADALQAGDISLAAQILWTALKLAWAEGTKDLQQRWSDFKATILHVAAEAFYGIQSIWAQVYANLKTMWVEGAAAFKSTWSEAVDTVAKVLEDDEKLHQKRIIDAEANVGRITKDEAEKRKAFVDQQFNKQRQLRDGDQKENQAQIQAELAAKLAAIDAERDKTLEGIDRDKDLTSQGIDLDKQHELTELEQRRVELQRQLTALRAKARGEAGGGGGGGAPLIPPERFSDLDDIAARQREAPKSQGTFNAFAIDALRGASTQDRIAKATEETARNTRKLKDFPSTRFT